MKKQNITKIMAMAVLANVSYMLHASSSDIVGPSESVSVSGQRAFYARQLNNLMTRCLNEFYDVARVDSPRLINIFSEQQDRYECNIDRVGSIISEIVYTIKEMEKETKGTPGKDGMRDDQARRILIDKENSRKMRAMISVLPQQEGLQEKSVSSLKERLDEFEQTLDDCGTFVDFSEIETTVSGLEKMNNREGLLQLLLKRINEFLDFAIIDSGVYEDEYKEDAEDLQIAVWDVINMARIRKIEFNEDELQETYRHIGELYTRSDLSGRQKFCVGGFLKSLQLLIRNDGRDTFDYEGQARNEAAMTLKTELATVFKKLSEEFLELSLLSSVPTWIDRTYVRINHVLREAQRKEVDLKDEFRELLDRCITLLTSPCTSETARFRLQDNVMRILKTIPEEQKLALGDSYMKIKDLCLGQED